VFKFPQDVWQAVPQGRKIVITETIKKMTWLLYMLAKVGDMLNEIQMHYKIGID
jgi:hypothetical protein